jgi:hypothetical protein
VIVISNALALAPGGNLLGTPIFGWRTVAIPSAISATTEADGFPASNLANPSTALRWKAADPGSPPADEYLTVAITQVDPVDYLAIAVHNLGSGQSPLSVEGSIGGSPEWFELVQETLHANDDPIVFRFEPQSLTGIRLRIQPGILTPSVAVLYVGKLLVAERGTHADHVPINLARTTRVMSGKSETGNFVGRVVLSEARGTAFVLHRLAEAWTREELEPFLKAAREIPFFFAWRPQAHSKDVGYCWLTEDPQPSRHFETGTYAISLQMSGVAA